MDALRVQGVGEWTKARTKSIGQGVEQREERQRVYGSTLDKHEAGRCQKAGKQEALQTKF